MFFVRSVNKYYIVCMYVLKCLMHTMTMVRHIFYSNITTLECMFNTNGLFMRLLRSSESALSIDIVL